MKPIFYTFTNLSHFPELVHGISTREYQNMKFTGNQDPASVISNRENYCRDLGINLNSIIVPEIVHSSQIAVVGQADKGKGSVDWRNTIKNADGLISRDYGVNLMITSADCVPILVYDPINKTVAAIHAGWRGIADGIVRQTVENFKSLGAWSDSLIVGIGPSICQKHFIVKNEVLRIFAGKYPKAVFVRNHDGYVDLKKCVADDFISNGVTANNIEIAGECTACNHYYFSSYRLEKEKTIFHGSIIGLRD